MRGPFYKRDVLFVDLPGQIADCSYTVAGPRGHTASDTQALALTAAQAQFAPYSGAPFLTRTRAET